MPVNQLNERVDECLRLWRVEVEDTLETHSSLITFGTRGNQPVVMKLLRQPGDEWRCGEVLDAFDGRGIVRVYEYIEGAVLLERLTPGNSLAEIALGGQDDEATEILAEVLHRMSHPSRSLDRFVTVEDWGKGFQRYLASRDLQIPASLVEQGQHWYTKLSESQQSTHLLHGDLQHYNLLFDSNRGWLAIDPKGVVGEIEFEIGASLRNPYEKPEMFSSPTTIVARLKRFEARLNLDRERMLGWGFAQAILSAIWSVEDGFAVDHRNPSLILANAVKPMLC